MKGWRRYLRWVVLCLTGLILVVVILNLWVVGRASGRIFSKIEEVPEVPVALVLGTSRYVRGQRNAFFFNRIYAAVALYRAGKVRKIIVSGDNGTESYNETDDMRRELIKRGIPEDDIVNDHAGFRTLDSVVRSKSVFGQSRILIVSQHFHLQRAIFIARAHGIDAVGFSADDPAEGDALLRVMTREYFARVKAWLDCYLLFTKPRFPGPEEPIRFD
jgi:SanA protein